MDHSLQAAFVHYGATLGDHVVIDADSFLMKGEVLAAHTRWCGNPAKMVCADAGDDMATCEPFVPSLAAE